MPIVIVKTTMKVDGVVRTINLTYASTIVKEYLKKGYYDKNEFITKAIRAAEEADKRVIEKFGFQCYGCVELLKTLNNLKEKNLDEIKVESLT